MTSNSTNSSLKIIAQKEKELRGKKTTVVILFVDMSGSTAYKDEKGSEKGLFHTVQHNLMISDVINKITKSAKNSGRISEGEICKYIGDEVMAYLKGKDAAQVATEISIKIQKNIKKINLKIIDISEQFHSKIGVDLGPVYFYEYLPQILDPQGLTVDRAARIVSLCKPDQIIISDSIYKKTLSNIKCGSKIQRKLKGIVSKVSIYEVLWNNKEQGISQTEKEYTIPQLLKFHSSHKSYKLDKNGNATITWKALVENTSDKTLNQFKMPISFDIYDKPSPTQFVKIKTIKIGNNDVDNPNQYYKTIGVLTSSMQTRHEVGSIIIPFSEFGNLEKNKPTTFKIIYKLTNAFKNMKLIGEYTGQDINHFTDNFQLTIYPPQNMKIQLIQSGTHPTGFDILDNKADLIDYKIMSETPLPIKTNSSLSWKIEKPYLGSKYRIYFKVY